MSTEDQSPVDDIYETVTRYVREDYDADDNFKMYRSDRSARFRRLKQIVSVLRTYDVFHGMTPEKLCNVFQALGPTFVKAGQILSMRSEILPQSYCDALARLRAHADPMPTDIVLHLLESEYSHPIEDIFAYIDHKPLGSASLAQVHRAILKTGEEVAVKVQRPGVRETMAQDIDITRSILKWASRVTDAAQIVDLRSIVDELWASFQDETDFLTEAKTLQEFQQFTNDFAYMGCPHVYMQFCTHKVVVMEYIKGIPLSHTDELISNGYSLKEIGNKLVDNYSVQILDEGFFHADPHPGNIIIRDGKIILIDLGMTGKLSTRMRLLLRNMIFAVAKFDSPTLEKNLLQLAQLEKDTSGVDKTALLEDIDTIIDEFGSLDLADLDAGLLMMSLIQLVQRNNLKLPGSVMQVARALITLEGTLTEFIPDINMIQVIERHIQRSFNIKDMLLNEGKMFTTEGVQATHGLLNSLSDSQVAMHQLTRGQLKVNAELVGTQETVRQLSYIVDRLAMAIIIAGLFVGSSIVYYARIQPVILGIPVVGMMGYVVAFVLGVWIVIDILRRNHQLKKESRHV